MDDPTTKATPSRARPSRHRPREHARPRHVVHSDPAPQQTDELTSGAITPKISEGDGGAFGRGPIDGDGGGRRPDRGGNDSGRLLIVLGIIAVGAGVMSARLLSKQRRG
ncbi:MAG: hypothetical protein M3R54_03795 [Chloroflexota bacterium]|nr:hypothetical protein [Chloroflexota bacterium]